MILLSLTGIYKKGKCIMEINSTKYHDEKAKIYDKSYNEPFWRFYNDITWSYIKKYLPKDIDNSFVLDAGGGTGFWWSHCNCW